MPWLLLQLSNGTDKSYSIVHSVNLSEDYETVFISRKVKYNDSGENCDMEGEVICVSENRQFIEEELEKRIIFDNKKNKTDDITNVIDYNNWFLVQYSKNYGNIIHEIVHCNDIRWSTKPDENSGSYVTYVNDGNQLWPTIILAMANTEAKLFDELQELKEICYSSTAHYNIKYPVTKFSKGFWLLIQYSCGVNNIVYAVVNSQETVWHDENQFNESVTYLTDGSNIYQGIIISKSLEREDIDELLELLKEKFLSLSLSKTSEDDCQQSNNTNSKIDVCTQTIDDILQTDSDICGERNCQNTIDHDMEMENILDHVKDLESNIHDEARSLTYALRYAEIINNQMEQRLVQLRFITNSTPPINNTLEILLESPNFNELGISSRDIILSLKSLDCCGELDDDEMHEIN